MLTTTSADGTEVRAFDEGHGPVILVLHPGLDDGSRWAKVAGALAKRYRVVRVQRRQYRLDLTDGRPWPFDREVEDVQALAAVLDEPILLVGHSSGGITALEAMAASPAMFRGGVVYEAPVITGPPLGGEALVRAKAAIAAGKPGKAMQIFIADVVKAGVVVAAVVRPAIALVPSLRRFAPRQVDDLEAIDRLGNRLHAYAAIDIPVLLVGGDKSPVHLGDRLDALERTLPKVERVVMHKRGHDANVRAPAELARVIERFADKVLR